MKRFIGLFAVTLVAFMALGFGSAFAEPIGPSVKTLNCEYPKPDGELNLVTDVGWHCKLLGAKVLFEIMLMDSQSKGQMVVSTSPAGTLTGQVTIYKAKVYVPKNAKRVFYRAAVDWTSPKNPHDVRITYGLWHEPGKGVVVPDVAYSISRPPLYDELLARYREELAATPVVPGVSTIVAVPSHQSHPRPVEKYVATEASPTTPTTLVTPKVIESVGPIIEKVAMSKERLKNASKAIDKSLRSMGIEDDFGSLAEKLARFNDELVQAMRAAGVTLPKLQVPKDPHWECMQNLGHAELDKFELGEKVKALEAEIARLKKEGGVLEAEIARLKSVIAESAQNFMKEIWPRPQARVIAP